MLNCAQRGRIAVLTALVFSYSAVAATQSIGIATVRGSIRVDGETVKGNVSLFEGSVVETDNSATSLRLDKGVVVKLAADSRGKLFRDRLVLEKGSSEFTSSYRLVASTLQINPADANSRGVVVMKSANKVEVTALAGRFQVLTDHGVLLANVRPGVAFAFDPQGAGATAPTTITGKLTKEGSNYYVTVAQTGLKYQVVGKDLTPGMVGKTVTVTGTPDPSGTPGSGSAAVITATSATVVGHAAAAAGGSAVGMAMGTKLIIAGVVVAASAGVGAGVYEAQKSDTPAASR